MEQSSLAPPKSNTVCPAEAAESLCAVFPGDEAGEEPTLNLVRRLCQALSEERISYCHWKSNNALDRSASGENDLDLLVNRADAMRFTGILNRLGFRQAIAPPGREMPGVLDYYGYDKSADRIVHVHAHYQLVLGHDMSKNYHLPVEGAYLDSATQDGLFKVPAPEFELVVFIIRMMLKHATWETILIRNGNLSSAEKRELAYLLARSDRDELDRILRHYLPSVSAELFDRCLQALQPGASIWTRIRTGKRLLNAVKPFARRGRIQDIGLKLWRRVTWSIQRRIAKHAPKRRLANSGAMIVVVGGDGAGKSTAIDGLFDWLSNDFEVFKVHLGKPTWSWRTKCVRAVLSSGRILGLYPFIPEASILYASTADIRLGLGHYALFLRQLCKSRDRLQAYVRARRQATAGSIVLCDRYPLPQINAMDGPIIRQMAGPANMNRLVKYLARKEEENHRAYMWPELLIVLKLDPQIAVQRKTDEGAEYVRTRSHIVYAVDWQQTDAHVIDASLGKEEVLTTLKHLVWSVL